jgi:DeoR family fructose operon transcriptional repressor
MVIKMLSDARKDYILKTLQEEQIVRIQDITIALNASESTIRRDLQDLEEVGALRRIHGGAKSITPLKLEHDMLEKSSKNTQEKIDIARYAAKIVKDEDVIYIDAGTTTLQILPFLKGKRITVVTNSTIHVTALLGLQIKAIIIGGPIKPTTTAVCGYQSVQQLEQYRFDKAFIGINGIHPDLGLTTADIEEAAMKKTAMKLATKSYVLADHSKFDIVKFAQVSRLENIHILCDYCPPSCKEAIIKQTTIKEIKK